jgi:hypothetical protein
MFGFFISKDSKNAELAKELKEENKKLTERLEKLEKNLKKASSNKRIEKLEEIVKKIPSNACGEGSILVYQDEEYKEVKLSCKADLEKVVKDAKDKKLELVFI